MSEALQVLPELDSNLEQMNALLAGINNQTSALDDKLATLDELESFARQLQTTYPRRAEPLVFQGLALATRAELSGGMSALKPAKAAVEILKRSLQLDDQAMQATALTTLGALYTEVPGWPIGFGSEVEAKKYLDRALAHYPDDIEANFFMAGYLARFHDRKEAIIVMEKTLRLAQNCNGHTPAENGRLGEIKQKLDNWKA